MCIIPVMLILWVFVCVRVEEDHTPFVFQAQRRRLQALFEQVNASCLHACSAGRDLKWFSLKYKERVLSTYLDNARRDA
jgi:hypothetical protein